MTNPELVLQIAKTAHAVNRVYCQSTGDFTTPEWDKTSDEVRAGYEKAVSIKLAATCSLEQQHADWMAVRIAEGWTVGPLKDNELKTNPCLVPYAELPEAMRFKDAFFQAVVDSFKVANES